MRVNDRFFDELLELAFTERLSQAVDGLDRFMRLGLAYAVLFARRRPVIRFAVCALPQCARNCVMNECSLRASTASGASASATASAV